jgi:hypothetical protein
VNADNKKRDLLMYVKEKERPEENEGRNRERLVEKNM